MGQKEVEKNVDSHNSPSNSVKPAIKIVTSVEPKQFQPHTTVIYSHTEEQLDILSGPADQM